MTTATSLAGPSQPMSRRDLTSAFGAKRKWTGRQSSLPRSKMTHNGSVAELSGARVQSFRHDCRHISHLNLLEREPRRLRHIGVYCTVKLVERRSLNTALFQ
jgi:hypothetical protein